MEIAGNTKWQSPPTRAASSADDDDSIVASDSAQAAICKRLAVAKMNPMVMAPFLEAFVLSKSDSNGKPEMPPPQPRPELQEVPNSCNSRVPRAANRNRV
jgi:hypothetical protein